MGRFHKQLGSRRWVRLRLQVLNRDGYRCVLCGRAGKLECDHITPMRRGGDPWALDNLQTLCRVCHVEKTRGDWRPPPTAAEAAWRAFVGELMR